MIMNREVAGERILTLNVDDAESLFVVELETAQETAAVEKVE